MQRLAFLVGVLLTATTAPLVLADEDAPLTFRARLERDLGAAGLGWEALPDPLPVQVVDLGSGTAWVEDRPLEAFLTEVEEGFAAPGGPHADLVGGATHRVLGDVAHSCQDPIKPCYRFYVKAVGSGTSTWVSDGTANSAYGTLRGAYDAAPARGALAFPLHGVQGVYVHGSYIVGGHRAASPLQYATLGSSQAGVSLEDGLPGSGATHGDRSLFGAGVGRVQYAEVPWGPGLVISFGNIRAHGAFTFCSTENNPDCSGS